MPPAPKVFKTSHRVRFSDLDPYNHMTALMRSSSAP
jgi:acyl-CoA thioesterase FadM